LLILAAAAAPARALTIPPAPTQPVNDYAHVLSPDAVARLNQQLLSYEPGSTRKIVVAIFPSLDDEAVEDFTVRLAEAWKVGYKDNKGVLVVLFLKERTVRIEVGYGLEGELTDAMSVRIIDELMKPRFREGDYEGGLRAALAAIDTATGGHEHDEGKLPARQPRGGGGGIPVGLIVFLIIFVIVAILGRRGGGGRGRGGGGFWPGFWLGGGGGGGWSGGSGGWSSGGGGGGGGWSGGGGGSFGGGGATGNW
jgi:uncharacterized protein